MDERSTLVTVNVSKLFSRFRELGGLLPRVAEVKMYVADWNLPERRNRTLRSTAKSGGVCTMEHQLNYLQFFQEKPASRHLLWLSSLADYTHALCLAAALVKRITDEVSMRHVFLNCDYRSIGRFESEYPDNFGGIIVLYGITPESGHEVMSCARRIVAQYSATSPVIFVGDGAPPSELIMKLRIPYTAMVMCFRNKAEIANVVG